MCDDCHWQLHEGGWRLRGDADGELTLIRPDGATIDLGSPQLRADIRRRFRLHLHTGPRDGPDTAPNPAPDTDTSGEHAA